MISPTLCLFADALGCGCPKECLECDDPQRAARKNPCTDWCVPQRMSWVRFYTMNNSKDPFTDCFQLNTRWQTSPTRNLNSRWTSLPLGATEIGSTASSDPPDSARSRLLACTFTFSISPLLFRALLFHRHRYRCRPMEHVELLNMQNASARIQDPLLDLPPLALAPVPLRLTQLRRRHNRFKS